MWKDILKYKATVKGRERFYENHSQFDNDEDRAKIKRHALAWNKAHVRTVVIDFYDALEYEVSDKDNLDLALQALKTVYSSWRDVDDDEMEEMERRSERSADAYFSGHGYNTGDY